MLWEFHHGMFFMLAFLFMFLFFEFSIELLTTDTITEAELHLRQEKEKNAVNSMQRSQFHATYHWFVFSPFSRIHRVCSAPQLNVISLDHRIFIAIQLLCPTIHATIMCHIAAECMVGQFTCRIWFEMQAFSYLCSAMFFVNVFRWENRFVYLAGNHCRIKYIHITSAKSFIRMIWKNLLLDWIQLHACYKH